MIITFEGAPAVGKTTISEELMVTHDCYIVPEVNKLFGKDKRESDLWYYQKQIQRWHLSTQSHHSKTLSLLDGDVFQPVWFSALFPDEDWGSFEKMVKFYSDMLDKNLVGFPHKYLFFHTEERVRAQRETSRSKRQGRSPQATLKKINRYRDFAISQYTYFSDLKQRFPELVVFLEATDKAESIKTILNCSMAHPYQDREIFKFIIDWCREVKQ
jgi:deoxyadenosine/deoxycytidine kinase